VCAASRVRLVTYEEPTAEVQELAMGFSRGFTAARAISEHTRREHLGQAMDLNWVMWILAAARAAGTRRLPLGGEAAKVRSLVAEAQRGRPQAADAVGVQRAQRGRPQAAGA
jgi:hypothetical protein